MTDWDNYDAHQRTAYRARNAIGGVVLSLPDDSQPTQTHQTEGHLTEIRNDVLNIQHFGFSSVPLPGGRGIALYPGGYRTDGIIVGTNDVRYRPTGLNPGEMQIYMVDGAKKDGTNGTTRAILQGLLGWVAKLFGVTILIGDSNTKTVTITGSNLIKLAGNVEITGTLKVDGATTVQDINIQGNESGGGTT